MRILTSIGLTHELQICVIATVGSNLKVLFYRHECMQTNRCYRVSEQMGDTGRFRQVLGHLFFGTLEIFIEILAQT
jgi:hypothetical protein